MPADSQQSRSFSDLQLPQTLSGINGFLPTVTKSLLIQFLPSLSLPRNNSIFSSVNQSFWTEEPRWVLKFYLFSCWFCFSFKLFTQFLETCRDFGYKSQLQKCVICYLPDNYQSFGVMTNAIGGGVLVKLRIPGLWDIKIPFNWSQYSYFQWLVYVI